MNTCACEERLTSWLLGDLPPPEADAIRLHVAACAACRARVAELEPVVAALRQGLTAAPAKPLRLYPARRRRVLATPSQTRFRRWWVASHPGLRLAAALVVIVGFFLISLIPPCRYAAKYPSDAVMCFETEIRAPEAPQALRELPVPSDRSDRSDRPDLSFTPEIAMNTPAPPPAPPPATLQPLTYGYVTQVKSPVTFGGTRSLLAQAGGRTGADAPHSVANDEIAVEVSLDGAERTADTSGAIPPATAESQEETARLREEVAMLEDRAAAMSSQIQNLIGEPPGGGETTWHGLSSRREGQDLPRPPAKPAPSRPAALASAGESDLRQRRDAAEEKVAHLERATSMLRGRMSAMSVPSGSPATLAPSSSESASRSETLAFVSGQKMPRADSSDFDGDSLREVPATATRTKGQGQIAARKMKNGADAIDPFAPDTIASETKAAEAKREEELTPEEATIQRMKEIVIPEINLRAANMKDVAAFFASASREFDNQELPPETRGVDFAVRIPDTPATKVSPAADDPFAPVDSQPADANGPAPITFGARFVSLYDAAKIVADVTDMKMYIRDGNQVVFVPQSSPACDRVTRTYDVDERLAAKLEQIQKDIPPTSRQEIQDSADPGAVDLTPLLVETGVSLPEGSSLTYLPQIRKLRAHLPPESLAEFERTLKELNAAATPEGGVQGKPSPAARVPAAHNPFVETRANPFSTFAIDVDTAAYTRTRQALTGGALPDPETVRTEELVNAFDYGDRAPENAVFRVYIEGAPAPFGAGLDLLRIGVKGRRLGREEQRPARLTFLVDASGSMDQPDRIGLARQALTLLLEQLAPQDRLQLIAFDDRARLLLEPTSPTDRAAILAAFDRLQCRGSTNLEDGMREAYALAARAFLPGGENRVILISDGVANLGTDSAADILANIEAHRRQGITCTVFGVGRGAYNDRMLEELANRGDGSYRFLDSPDEVRRAFVDDLAATLNTIATDVKIQVEWDPAAVSRYRQLGYENRALTKEQFRDDTVDAGEVGSGQSVTALYEFERAEPAARNRPLGMVRVRYRRVDTQAIEEIEQPILPRQLAPQIEAARPELRLAACAAEFAELLRRSPYAAGSRFADVARLLHPVALEMKLDTRVGELLRLVELAQGMGD